MRWGRVAGASELLLVVGGGIKSHTCVLGSPRVLAVVEFQFWGDELLVLCRASVLVEHVEGVLPSPRAAYRFHCHTISPCPEKQKGTLVCRATGWCPVTAPGAPGCAPRQVLRCSWGAFCREKSLRGLWVGLASPIASSGGGQPGHRRGQTSGCCLEGSLWLDLAAGCRLIQAFLPCSPILSLPCPAGGRERRCWDQSGGLALF